MKRILALIVLTIPGCAVWDQDVFSPTPEAVPRVETTGAPVLPVIDPRTPLVTIDYTRANPDYAEVLRLAVRQAEARRRNVRYDVILVIKDAAEATAVQERATQVMRTIMAERVPAGRIHLGLRAEPAMPGSQVRVYVR